MKKEYFNQEAYDYISRQINKTQINPVFRPIMIDIILRRRHEYQLDDKYFHRDVQSFVNNVNQIYFEDLPEEKNGDFCFEKKFIRINRNNFKEKMDKEEFAEKLLGVLSHECGHAMNFDETGNDRTFKIDPTDPADSTIPINGIFEIFTEKASDRLISNRNQEDALKYYNETLGYGATAMYVDAIAAAFGIKEKDLLSAYIKGEQELYEALNVNINDENFSKDKFKEISFNIRIAHKELRKDKNDEIDLENLGDAVRKIYKNSEQVLEYRINNLEWDNLEELKEKLEDIKLSQNAISNIIPAADEKWAKSEKYGKRMVYSKVMCMEQIIKSKNENSRELISFVQHSESVEEILEFMKQNGIEIDSENLALMPEFELSQQKKDEWVKEFCLDGEEWDNTEQTNYVMTNIEKMMKLKEKVSFKDKMESLKGKVSIPYIWLKKGLMLPFKLLGRAGKNLWKALPKKEKPLLLGERRRRKNRRQKIVGCI